ncbi:MAG: DUF4176 domain-containing protein [Lachnospiraceae bacterium]|nr:DUF4176 domain-containing protein [Lachnospiraceae bacterium]
MMKEFLPIGTVVNLNQAEEYNFMIIGLLVENTQNERRDYVAVRYPVGAMGNAKYYFFNNENIKEVVHMGYVNDDHKTYAELLNSVEKQINMQSNKQ